jgi:hypothetical protein
METQSQKSRRWLDAALKATEDHIPSLPFTRGESRISNSHNRKSHSVQAELSEV